MNNTEVQHTIVSIKPQIVSASSKIAPSPPPFIALEIVVRILKESLCKNKFMIIGSIISAIAMMAIVP